jgi:hypothetical protein
MLTSKLTKAQYELLEDFGLKRLDDSAIPVEELRKAVHRAVLLFPFNSVEGFEHFAAPSLRTRFNDWYDSLRGLRKPAAFVLLMLPVVLLPAAVPMVASGYSPFGWVLVLCGPLWGGLMFWLRWPRITQ